MAKSRGGRRARAAEHAEFLLEIGCEEIPAPWLRGLTMQLDQRFVEIATRESLAPVHVEAHSTPRRLIVHADVEHRQADREEIVWGPSLGVARDASGAWTAAAHGFARKQGTTPDALHQTPKDPTSDERYLKFIRRTPGQESCDVLPSVIASLLRSLTFPKRMSWDAWLEDGKGALPFGRPIRWLVALLDGDVVPFTVYELVNGARGGKILHSGAVTYGHRFLPRGRAGRPVRVSSFDNMREALKKHCVVIDAQERAERIRSGLAAEADAEALAHPLTAEWCDLVEYPTVVFGQIPAAFRSLPTEVLHTVLVHHQKYIPLSDESRSVSRFAGVVNTDGRSADAIVRGMERVVVARLRDASFFYEEDRKRPLAKRVDDLSGITFHRGLGDYKQKTERMVSLVSSMGEGLGLLTKAELQAAREAAHLAKADLTTLMVREFPELQGRMGGIYLRAQGDVWESVANTVEWHYFPVSIEEGTPPAGELPEGDLTIFCAVSLADKLDTLVGYFGLGLAPSGSSDPFGLRRAAQCVIRVLLDFWVADTAERRPSLRRLVEESMKAYGAFPSRSSTDVTRDLESFLLDRLRYVLASRGFSTDEVEAVIGARDPDALDDPHECLVRLRALKRVRLESREDLEYLAIAFKRAKNIIGDGARAEVDPALFREDAERALHEVVRRLHDSASDGYESRLRALAGLRLPVDRFFDDVMVMTDDPKLRANRLGLLAQTLSLFYRIADISKLGG